MITKDEFESLYQEALERVVERGMDVNDLTNVFDEIVNIKRELKQAREVIENPEYREQAIKASEEELARQAKILEQGRIPTVYDDEYVGDVDDDYDDDYDDECYPDDE